MKVRRLFWVCLFLAILLVLFARFYRYLPGGERLVQKMRGRVSTEERLQQFGAGARARLEPLFARAGVAYPPRRIVLVGLKEEHQLELYAASEGGALKLIC